MPRTTVVKVRTENLMSVVSGNGNSILFESAVAGEDDEMADSRRGFNIWDDED